MKLCACACHGKCVQTHVDVPLHLRKESSTKESYSAIILLFCELTAPSVISITSQATSNTFFL